MKEEKKTKETVISVDVEFSDIFDITVAEEYRLKLLDALNKLQSVNLLAKKVERADTAALQMLCAFVKDANTAGISVNWHEPSKNLRQAAELLGLIKPLNLANVT